MGEQLDIGRVLSRSWTAFMQNFVAFFGLAILVNILPIGWQVFLHVKGVDQQSPESLVLVLGGLAGTTAVGLVLGQLLAGTITYGVMRHLGGFSVDLAECLNGALRRLLPLLVVSFLMGLGIFFGLLLCIVPGVMLMCMWYCATPVTVMEDVGVARAFERSAELTAGSRWVIFALTLILGLGGGAVMGVIGGVQGAVVLKVRNAAYGFFAAQLVVGALVSAFTACAAAVAYHELRRIRGEVDENWIRGVFD